jgi:hypothetical protein
MILTGKKLKYGGETCLIVTLSPIKVTWAGLKSNPALRNEMSVTNRLCHGTALKDRANLKYI